MPSALSNKENASIWKQYAEGKVAPDKLLEAEMAAYHTEGTCTFYGTANSNQMLLEAMGLMILGAAFVQPNDPCRALLTHSASVRVAALTKTQLGIGE